MTEIPSPTLDIEDRQPRLKEISSERRPETVLVIPDGNVRWATSNGLSSFEGHIEGGRVMFGLLQVFVEIPETKNLMAWGLSHENWKRPNQEIKGVMKAIEQTIELAMPFFDKHKVRFARLGREDKIRGQFPSLWRTIQEAKFPSD